MKKLSSLISTVALLYLVFGFDVSSADYCPPETTLRPCTCDSPTTTVRCSGVLQVGTLVDVLNRSADDHRQFSNFVLLNSTVMYLPSHALIGGKKVAHLVVYNSFMGSLLDSPPREDNRIMTILLRNASFQRALDWALVSPMKKLKLFRAENTLIRTLGKSFTENVSPGLTALILGNTETRRIRHDAFAKLSNLFHLEITDAEIKMLNRSMFAIPSALEEMNFSGNQIEDLPEDIFSDMPSLREVDFSRNRIEVVSQAIFGDIVNRNGRINLDGNPLKCDCSMYWYVTGEKKGIQGTCASPLDQKGKVVQYMSEKDLDYCG